MKIFHFSCLLLASVFVLTSCGKSEQSPTTGWNLNDPEWGGFEVSDRNEQVTAPGLVFIEGGSFTMGRVADDSRFQWNNVAHTVTVSSFYMDETEVTNLAYHEFVYWMQRAYGEEYPERVRDIYPDTNAWRDKLAWREGFVDYYFQSPIYYEYPVVGVFAVVKIEYIAECAFIITFSWFTAEFLHYKFPLWAYLLEGLVSFATIISVMWMEKTTLFYRSYSMDYSGLVPVAVVEPGVMYYVFYGLVVILCLIIVVVGLYKMRKVGFIDAKRIRSILWAIASLWAFIGARIIGLTKYDLISFGILSSMCIIAFAIVRYGFVNPAQIAADNAINHISEGIIVLDTSNQIIMLNKTSRALFPSLVEGGHISAIDGIEEILSDKRTTMEKDGNIYEFRKESLQENNIFCGYLLWAINITDQMKYLNVIKEQAETDSLTHLYNRIYFTNKVTEALRERAGGTLFMMDLDNFKGVNDHYGHGVGDGVLVTFAEHIRDCFRAREESIICRLGGDEFIVYIPEKLEESAVEEIVDNLIDNFSTKMIKAGLPTGTGCSVGICFAYKGSEFEDVYRNADKALYCAKARGKNTFMYFDAETMNDKRSEDN